MELTTAQATADHAEVLANRATNDAATPTSCCANCAEVGTLDPRFGWVHRSSGLEDCSALHLHLRSWTDGFAL